MALRGAGTEWQGRKNNQGENIVNALEQRKTDIKSRIAVLSAELLPALARVENLRERISDLEYDLRDVLDEIREKEKTKGKK